jgi:hypothetical protein
MVRTTCENETFFRKNRLCTLHSASDCLPVPHTSTTSSARTRGGLVNCACGVRVRRLDACTFPTEEICEITLSIARTGLDSGPQRKPGIGAVLESSGLAIGFDLWETSVVASKRIVREVKGLVRGQPLVLASVALEVLRFLWIYLKEHRLAQENLRRQLPASAVALAFSLAILIQNTSARHLRNGRILQ